MKVMINRSVKAFKKKLHKRDALRHTLEIDKKYTNRSFHTFVNLIEKVIINFCPLKPFSKRLCNHKIKPWITMVTSIRVPKVSFHFF